MPWVLVNSGVSVVGKQSLGVVIAPTKYYSLLITSASSVEQKYFGTLSEEFLNTPESPFNTQYDIKKLWTRGVVSTNKDPFNPIGLFVFWRYAGETWQVWRFD